MAFDPTSAVPDSGDFDPTSAAPDAGGPDTRTVLKTVTPLNPDQAARADALGKQYNLPANSLLRNLRDAEMRAAVDKADERLRTSPKLAEHMRTNPFVAAQSHDDIEPLAKIESGTAAITGASVTSAVLGMGESVWRTPDAAQRAVGTLAEGVEKTGLPRYLNPVRGVQDLIRLVSEGSLPTGYKFMSGTTDVADKVGDAQKILSEDFTPFKDVQTLAKNADQALHTAVKTGQLQQLGQVVTNPDYWASFLAQAVPSLYTAIKSGGSMAVMGWLEGMDAANSAADFEQKTGVKIGDAEFTQAVAQSAIVNSILEKTGLDTILGAKGNGLKGVVKAIFGEGGTEALQQINSNLSEWLAFNPDKPLLEGVVASAMGGAGAGGGVSTAQYAATRVQAAADKRTSAAQKAQLQGARVEDLMQSAEGSALRTRNPQAFRSLVEDVSGQHQVYVDAEVLNQLPPEILQQFEGVAEQMPEALAANTAVPVKLSDILTYTSGTPAGELLSQNVRTTPDAMSAAEGETAAQTAADFMKNEAERVLADAQGADVIRESAERVRTNIAEQITATGRYRPAVSDAMGQWAGAFYTTMAARTGVTPEELFQRYPLKVLAEAGVRAQAPETMLTQGDELDLGDFESLMRGPGKRTGVQDNASGESSASLEAQGRVEQERALDRPRYVLDTRSGEVRPLTGVDAVDTEAAANQVIVQKNVGANTWTVLSTGPSVTRNAAMAAVGRGQSTGTLKQTEDERLRNDLSQPAVDSLQRDAKALTDFLEGQSAGAQGGGLIDIPPAVMRHVASVVQNDEVRRRVVAALPVSVVDFFAGKKLSADEALRNVAMLKDVLAVDGPSPVALGVNESITGLLMRSVASSAAEIAANLTGRTVKDGAAGRAGKGDSVLGAHGRSITETEAFSKWFGDSKVVDANGDPLVVYHGTTGDFSEFDASLSGSKSKTGAPEGSFFFTDKSDVASSYTVAWQGDWSAKHHDGGNVAPVYLSIKKPLKLNAKGESWREILYKGEYLDVNEVAKLAQESGKYDGVIVTKVRDKGVGTTESKTSTTYIAFKPTQIKSAIGNDGSFDTNDPSILSQGPRGTFNPATLELVLNENANLSTWFHETGHFYLEVMADLAGQPEAPQQVKDDWQKMLDWFGVTDAQWRAMTLDEQRKYHERWAESIEQYVMEGKAPSAELAPVMRRFAAWLKAVYRSIKQFLATRPDAEQMPLNDGIRAVMDRMLATDEQIANANEVAGLAPDEEADDEAGERLRKRSIADLKYSVRLRDQVIRELQKKAKGVRDAVRARVKEEADALPEVRAKAALDALRITPEHAGLLSAWKEERAAAEKAERERFKAELLEANPDAKGLKKGQLLAKSKREINNKVEAFLIQWDREHPKPSRPINSTDEDVATVADSFGYESVDQMLEAISAFGSKQDYIDGRTEQVMLEEHGDLMNEDAIAAAANEAVHSLTRQRVLASELRTQGEMLGRTQETGEVNAAGRAKTVNVLIEAAKQFGARVVGRAPAHDLKATAWRHTAAERRAGKRYTEMTAAGKTAEAVQAKQDQLLNNAAAKAAIDAQAEVQKIGEFFKRVLKGNDETVVEKGRDPDVVNAARAVLTAYGMQSPAGKGAAAYLEALKKNDPETYAAVEPMMTEALANAQPLESMTLDELRGLNEQIQAMWYIAKRMRQMEVDGDLLDIQEAADDLHARMGQIGIPNEVPGERGALTKREEASRVMQFAASLLRRVEQWAEGMDGKSGGPFAKYVFGPIKQAADAYRTDRKKFRKKFQDLVDQIAPSMRHETIEAPELNYTFGRGHNGIGSAELLHAMLHTGNESNKRKLLLGRGWATENPDGTLDTSKWDAFVARMVDEGKITKAHYDFLQGVWDLMEETKPLAQKAHRDVFGRYFDEVTAGAFVDPFGEPRRGGYVPAQADPAIVNDADLRALVEGENESMAYSFPATSKGFTKGRVEYNRPLKLDLRSLPQHIDKVLLFSHMEPAVRGVSRLLRNKGVSQPLGRIDPSAYSGMLLPWLNRSARQLVETPIVGDGRISKVASALRRRAGAALMFANVSNTVQQITGFSTAAVKVKPSNLMSAAATYLASPKKTVENVAELSPYMASRMDAEVSAMNDAMNDILLKPSVYEKAQAWSQRHAYFLQSAFDNVLSSIVWTGAYNEALQDKKSESDAVKFADSTVRQTQGSTLPEDISRIETGPAYARLFTQFIGYFNMMANTNATALKQISEETGLKRGAGKALYVVLMGLLVPLWVAEAIAIAFRGGPDDEEGDGYLDDWIAQVLGMGTIKGLLAQVPFVGQLANAAMNRFNDNPADDKVSASPAVSLLEGAAGAPASVYKAIVEDGSKRKAIRDVASLVNIATGLPATAVARPLGYAAGVLEGDITPTSGTDTARGLVTGAVSPDSRNR